jgi:predicted RNA-binding protein with TRAM domain
VGDSVVHANADAAVPVPVEQVRQAAGARLPPSAELALARMGLDRIGGNRSLARAIAAKRVLARNLDSDYRNAVAAPDWPLAAEYLNGFNREDICSRLAALSAASVGRIHQGALDNPRVGPMAQVALLTPTLLTAFGLQFRDAAEAIRRSTEAMRLVTEGENSHVGYAGFSEDGPGAAVMSGRAYTVGSAIYVPRTQLGDKVMAARDYLFEINNAVRQPRFAAVSESARQGNLTADQFADRYTALEVEGMLRLGRVWTSLKADLGGGHDLDRYDNGFFFGEYNAVASGAKTEAQLDTEVGNRRYESGPSRGKTVHQYYIDQFNASYGHH